MMDSAQHPSFLEPSSAAGDTISKQRAETTRIAKEQEKAIHEKLSRNNHEIPKYEFLELIGKGAYGRVFKALDQVENRIVALKVIDVDLHDYKVNAREKDDSIEVTLHEIKVLKQLKDAKTKNVNMIFDAFQIHSQLWIVNEYCPGGSVRTLMRGTGDRLEEKYIIPIARELAIALKAIHDGGIIHRDVKAANVMVHENGRLQVIDFGVAGVLQNSIDKRSTVIGTPHWMAPELHKNAPPGGLNYGTEVDVWAYGCTLYEIATGLPPYPRTQPGRPLGATLGRKPPRLDKAVHSEGLSDLVAFVLEAKPADRPSMDAVLQHPYILGSEDTYPTESLAELVRVYYRWERSGGQRQSLFINAGAAAAEFPQTLHEDEDWNFSTTANFEKEFSEIPLDSSTTVDKTTPPAFTSITDSSSTQPQVSVKKNLTLPSITIPAQSPKYHFDMGDLDNETQTPTGDLTPVDKLNTEERVKRGENALKGLFNENQAPYKYEVKADFVDQKPATILGPVPSGKLASRRTSDLPLRDESGPSSVSRKELDANQLRSTSYDNIPSIDLAPVGTIKANRMNRFLENMNQEDKSNDTFYYGDRLEDEKRATRDWTFPAAAPKDVLQDPKRATIEWGFPPEMQAGPSKPQLAPERPALKHTVTAPVGDIRHSTAGMIDLDALYDDPLYDSDILRTAPPSDDEAVSRPTLIGGDPKFKPASANDNLSHKSINDDGPSSLLRTALTEDDLAKAARSHSPFTASSDSDWEMDPFMFKDMSEDDKKSEINAYLDEEGVTDVQERTSMQHDLLKARKAVPDILKEDMEEADYEKYKKSGYVNAVGDDKEKSQGAYLWEKYDPDINPAPQTKAYAMGPQTRIGDPDYPLMGGLKTQFHVTNQRDEEKPTPTSSPEARTSVASRAFPHITPPSAESLMEGAPASVLEAELRRLLGDWTAGLEVLGEIFEQDLAGSSSAGGSAGVSKRHGKGAEEEEEEEEEQREEES